MALLFETTGPPGGGLGPTRLTTTVTKRGGTAVLGDVLQFDLEMSDGDVDNLTPGSATSGWNNVVDPTSNAVLGHAPALFCVALEDAADDGELEVCYWGLVDAFIIAPFNTFTRGAAAVASTASNFQLVDSGEPFVAILSEIPSDTTPTTRTLSQVFLFNHFLSGGGV